MNKDSKEQGKLGKRSGRLLPAVERHSLEQNRIEQRGFVFFFAL